MALQHSTDDIISMRIDLEHDFPVVEMQFKFVRYRLACNNIEKVKELKELLEFILDKDTQEESKGEVKFPKFYKSQNEK